MRRRRETDSSCIRTPRPRLRKLVRSNSTTRARRGRAPSSAACSRLPASATAPGCVLRTNGSAPVAPLFQTLFNLSRAVGAVAHTSLGGVRRIEHVVEFLAVVGGSIGPSHLRDQLVRRVHVDVVLVAVETPCFFVQRASLSFRWYLVSPASSPSHRHLPVLDRVILPARVALFRRRHDGRVHDLASPRCSPWRPSAVQSGQNQLDLDEASRNSQTVWRPARRPPVPGRGSAYIDSRPRIWNSVCSSERM